MELWIDRSFPVIISFSQMRKYWILYLVLDNTLNIYVRICVRKIYRKKSIIIIIVIMDIFHFAFLFYRNFAVSNGLVNLPLYNTAGFCGLCLYKDTYGLATNHSCVSNSAVVDSSVKDQPHYSSSGSETSDNPPNLVSTI